MKATILFRMLVLAAMVFASATSVSLRAEENKFITNEEVSNGLVVSKVFYRLDGSLHRHLKYDFTYDDQKRVASKEVLKWNDQLEKWIPCCKFICTYLENEITIEYARWNDKYKTYDQPIEKSSYALDETNTPIAYAQYKRDKGHNDWVISIQNLLDKKTVLLLATRK